jgi:gliding motility-associated lipoprotein GldH
MKNTIAKSRMLFSVFCLLTSIFFFSSCSQLNIYEQDATIPKYEWHYDFTPSFNFMITDTAAQYALYIVLRHTDTYRYNNICLNLGTQWQGDSLTYQRFDLSLGSDAQGWEGSGMDDIWEVRKPLTQGPFKFKQPGNYRFVIAQQMRENPLNDIMSVGVRVEKLK